MECSRIPAVDLWDELPEAQLENCRRHLRSCLACRRRVLAQSPDQLLFLLGEETAPEDFWGGFWDSLERRVSIPEGRPRPFPFARWTRWIAVFAFGIFVMLLSRTLPDDPVRVEPRSPLISRETTDEFPIIEANKDSNASYYIIQSAGNAKIVMIYDPDLQL